VSRKLILPLAAYVIPTVLIGYGFVIPRSCIAGVNDLTIGFAFSIVGACATYVAGVKMALRANPQAGSSSVP
jgi:hypothetical protein